MCGIAGLTHLESIRLNDLPARMRRMGDLVQHRGPDGEGDFYSKDGSTALTHRRLSVIDLSDFASQPMVSALGTAITFNGEIYNFASLRSQLSGAWQFSSNSDTEVILAGFDRWGPEVVNHLKGMFSFAVFDEKTGVLFCARDRFGIKPFYYTVVDDVFYFASEMKALLPFLERIETAANALGEYLTFQYTLGSQTLFAGVSELPPGHTLLVQDGRVTVSKYWDLSYELDFSKTESQFIEEIRQSFDQSISEHLVSDVEIGGYVSGGLDSSLVFRAANSIDPSVVKAFHGRFTSDPGFDEHPFAELAMEGTGGELHSLDVTSENFQESIRSLIYSLDTPVAGPGSFPQYMVSQMAAQHVKVVLGGQGGDELFGGYARYMIAYLEQALSGAIDGTHRDSDFVVTLESIIPNLGLLKEYKPLIKKTWSANLFGDPNQRYFDLLDKSRSMVEILQPGFIDANALGESFHAEMSGGPNYPGDSYIDRMMHFDFKNLLPALLQVEDRVSMAHGLESRVPLLDHELVGLVTSIPPKIKFAGGVPKKLMKEAFSKYLPGPILNRRDKMGFPVPISEWSRGKLRDFIGDTLLNSRALSREYVNPRVMEKEIFGNDQFSRSLWALLSLELWQQEFHDKASQWRFKGH